MTNSTEPERPAVYAVSIFASAEQAAEDLLRVAVVPDEPKINRRAPRPACANAPTRSNGCYNQNKTETAIQPYQQFNLRTYEHAISG